MILFYLFPIVISFLLQDLWFLVHFSQPSIYMYLEVVEGLKLFCSKILQWNILFVRRLKHLIFNEFYHLAFEQGKKSFINEKKTISLSIKS